MIETFPMFYGYRRGRDVRETKKKINDFCVSLKAAYLMNLVGILYGKVDNEDNGMAHEAN